MTEVWEYSQASGTRLLILLALADRARKEDAVCWPGVAAIAHQARVTDRDVRHHLVALEASGEERVLQLRVTVERIEPCGGRRRQ